MGTGISLQTRSLEPNQLKIKGGNPTRDSGDLLLFPTFALI